jgi:3D (Asp-Asp-Asp) domain-containing protein
LKGRPLCVAFAVAVLGLCSTASVPAAVAPIGHVAWHRDGLLTWERVERRSLPPQTIHQLSIDLVPGRTAILAAGHPGIIEQFVRYAQRDGGPVYRSVVWSRVVHAPRPRVVAEGIRGTALSNFAAHGIKHMAYMARDALLMLATAYTADSAGGDGMTAIGRRAGLGIVAVDPRVIPLGTRLFIPGYGFAVAGDTGGDIVGRRIDLGFDTQRDAMAFGRRSLTVYRLKQ